MKLDRLRTEVGRLNTKMHGCDLRATCDYCVVKQTPDHMRPSVSHCPLCGAPRGESDIAGPDNPDVTHRQRSVSLSGRHSREEEKDEEETY